MPLPPEPVMNMRDCLASEAVDFGLEALQKLQHLLGLLGVVALVVRPEDLVGGRSMTTAFTVVEPTSIPIRKCFVHGCLPGLSVPLNRCQFFARPGRYVLRSSSAPRCAARNWPPARPRPWCAAPDTAAASIRDALPPRRGIGPASGRSAPALRRIPSWPCSWLRPAPSARGE